MSTQLSSLAVRPDLDPSKFVQGAQQLDAAASSAGKAVAGVGVASDEVNRKISQAGDVVGRLSRQYVDGYASAQRFESALNSLSREMTKGNLTINQAQPILDGIYRKYGLMGDAAQFAAKGQMELAAAITNANARLEQQRRIVPANSNSRISSGMAQAAGFNVGQQLQDVAMMAALGQSPLTMAFQQGPQIATAIEQGGGIAALRTGLASLLSPTMGITIALTAAAGAAIQFGSSIISRGKSIDDVLKGHKSLIDEITKSFPQAAAAAKQYEDQAKLLPQSVVAADTSQQAKDEAEKYQKAMRDFRVQFNLLIQGDTGQADFARVGKAGVAAFAEISKGIKTGQIDAIELQRRLGELRLNPDLSKTTQDFYKALQDAVNPAAELERHMQGTAAAVHGIAGGFNGPGGLPIYLDPNAGTFDRNKALSDEQTQLSRTRRSFTADIAGVTARSPLERAGAARMQAAATVNEGETPQERQLRIDLAGQRALIEAQHQLDEAQRQRKRSLDATLASQQMDLDVIGKTTGQVAAMRLEFQLTQQLREEASRNNVPVDQKELELIKQKAAAYGQMADQIARAKLGDDLAFERSQIFRNSGEQAIASRLRGTGLGMDSPEAQTMRQNQQLSELKTASQSFVSTFASTLQSSGGDIGKSFGAALLAGLQNYEQKAIEQLGDILFKILSSALSMAPTGGATGAGSIGAGVAGIAGKILGGANDNYAPGAVTRAPLPAIGATGSGYSVANATGFIRQYASAIGIDSDTALKVARGEGLGSGIWQSNLYRGGIREPSFGPFQLLKGGPGTGFGTGLGNQFMAQTGLDPADPANWQRSTAFALDQAKTNGWGAWYGAKAQGITGFMGIDRSVSNAVGALDKLASSSADTAASLTTGLGSLGKNLANVFPAAPTGGGGGGIFGFLGSLFGGSRSLSATAMAAVAAGPGGLYDVGGFTGHGGRYDVAGLVHRGEYVFDADATARIGVANLERMRKLPGYAAGGYVRALPAANGNSADAGMGGMHITIGWARGASGMLEPAISDVVRRDAPGIAKQQSQGAIAEYHENQRRGGFGTLQKQYSAQKG